MSDNRVNICILPFLHSCIFHHASRSPESRSLRSLTIYQIPLLLNRTLHMDADSSNQSCNDRHTVGDIAQASFYYSRSFALNPQCPPRLMYATGNRLQSCTYGSFSDAVQHSNKSDNIFDINASQHIRVCKCQHEHPRIFLLGPIPSGLCTESRRGWSLRLLTVNINLSAIPRKLTFVE